MLIEPTESESLAEIDRFCDAMLKIREEVDQIIAGKQPRDINTLKMAPHPLRTVLSDSLDWCASTRLHSAQLIAQ